MTLSEWMYCKPLMMPSICAQIVCTVRERMPGVWDSHIWRGVLWVSDERRHRWCLRTSTDSRDRQDSLRSSRRREMEQCWGVSSISKSRLRNEMTEEKSYVGGSSQRPRGVDLEYIIPLVCVQADGLDCDRVVADLTTIHVRQSAA
jgi:hypothetical protein